MAEPEQQDQPAAAEQAQPEAAAPAAKAAPPPPPGQREPAKPEAAALQAALAVAWEGVAYTEAINFGDLEVAVAPDAVYEACRRCKTVPALGFDALMLVTGVDYETAFDVLYHLYSSRHHHRLTIRTRLEDYEHAAVASVTPLWPAADWHERETAEMLGIDFPGHPNLVPLLLEEGVDERPLRKSHGLVELYSDRPGIVMEPQA